MAIEKLIPPDLYRCQCEWVDGSFMTFGPQKQVRCKKTPYWIATENKPAVGHTECGSMSLCSEHKDALIKQLGGKREVTFTAIDRSKLG